MRTALTYACVVLGLAFAAAVSPARAEAPGPSEAPPAPPAASPKASPKAEPERIELAPGTTFSLEAAGVPGSRELVCAGASGEVELSYRSTGYLVLRARRGAVALTIRPQGEAAEFTARLESGGVLTAWVILSVRVAGTPEGLSATLQASSWLFGLKAESVGEKGLSWRLGGASGTLHEGRWGHSVREAKSGELRVEEERTLVAEAPREKEPKKTGPRPVAAPTPAPGGPAETARRQAGLDRARDARRLEELLRERAEAEARARTAGSGADLLPLDLPPRMPGREPLVPPNIRGATIPLPPEEDWWGTLPPREVRPPLVSP